MKFSICSTADPLMGDIAHEFQGNYRKFEATAREWTEKFAAQVGNQGWLLH